MEQWFSVSDRPSEFAASAVTIGKFDGIHLGHQQLLREVLESSEEHGLAAVCLTFDRNPAAVVAGESAPGLITGHGQKARLLESFGMDALLTLRFDEQLAEMSAEQFVTEVLVQGLAARVVVVGEGFHFGRGGHGDAHLLRLMGFEHGFTVREVPTAQLDGRAISSTVVRELLDQGDVVAAAKMLGRNHVVRGVIEHGKKLGRTIGFPTANMSRSAEGYLPLDAVYAGRLSVVGAGPELQNLPAALSVGINETFEAVPRVLEAYVLDRTDLDLYDLEVDMEFVEMVRPTRKFDSVESLIEAIKDDVARIKTVLAS